MLGPVAGRVFRGQSPSETTAIGPGRETDARDVNRPWRPPFAQSFTRRSRNAFEMTETDDRLIAAAAIMGDSNSPTTG